MNVKLFNFISIHKLVIRIFSNFLESQVLWCQITLLLLFHTSCSSFYQQKKVPSKLPFAELCNTRLIFVLQSSAASELSLDFIFSLLFPLLLDKRMTNLRYTGLQETCLCF